MIVLTPLDWFWVIAFVLVTVFTGILFYHLGKKSSSDFFLAGRGLPWWLPAMSVYATHTATDTPMWISGVVYKHGLAGLWYSFFSAWCAISAFVSTRIFRRSPAYTQAEWQSLRYSKLGAELLRGWLAGWQVFMNMFILGWVGIAMGKICHMLFGWPEWVGLVVLSSLVAIYVLTAGYWGVIVADFQQGIVALLAIVIVSVWGIHAAGGPAKIIEKLQLMGQIGKINPLHFTGQFPLAWFLTMLFVALLGGLGMGSFIDWYPEAQRIQSAKTLRDASYSIWWGTALVFIRNALWGASVLAFFVLFPDIKDTAQYELAWYRLGFQFLPVGMVGFFFASLIAIYFSTVSTHLNLGAMYLTRDIYQHYINPKADERQLVWVGRISTLIILLGSFVYGLMMREITSWLIFALWTMTAGMWLPSILQVIWWRFNSWGYLSAWAFTLGFSWLLTWILPELGLLPKMPDYLQFWILLGLSAIISIGVTLLTPPEDEMHLVRFYVMSRPLGFWGPIRRKAKEMGLI